MAEITLENVSAVVGTDGFTLKRFPNGNVQVMIKDLGSLGPYDQCKVLITTADKLVAAGLIANANDAVRLSWNTGKKDSEGNDIWRPYPQLWVNKPTVAQKNTEEVSELRNEFKQLTGMFTQLTAMLQGNTEQSVDNIKP